MSGAGCRRTKTQQQRQGNQWEKESFLCITEEKAGVIWLCFSMPSCSKLKLCNKKDEEEARWFLLYLRQTLLWMFFSLLVLLSVCKLLQKILTNDKKILEIKVRTKLIWTTVNVWLKYSIVWHCTNNSYNREDLEMLKSVWLSAHTEQLCAVSLRVLLRDFLKNTSKNVSFFQQWTVKCSIQSLKQARKAYHHF